MSQNPALSVTQLTAQIKGLMEDSFPDVWVTGEVSNFSRPASGHCYFTLKDETAQIRAVVWRGSAAKLKFDMTDGLEIVCHGRLDVYAPRGSYQLVVNQAQPQGMGALELALQQLKEKLAAEGLFNADRKQQLPRFPKRVGFVTSPTGAAIRDFLEVARRRWQGVQVLVIPTRVQGEGAAAEIAEGIQQASRLLPALDVLVVGRGGGSMEDLWCFNEEPVVRAIAACPLPTVSAVGHEIDVTLADLVADVRALTPSEAAERVMPSGDEFTGKLSSLGQRLHAGTRRGLLQRQTLLDSLARRRPFERPHALVQDHAGRLDELELALRSQLRRKHQDHSRQLDALAGKLQSLSPLAVLGRGYSITQDSSGRVIKSASQLAQGEQVFLRFAEGTATAEVQ